MLKLFGIFILATFVNCKLHNVFCVKWKHHVFRNIKWPKKWTITPYELEPYEVEYFIGI